MWTTPDQQGAVVLPPRPGAAHERLLSIEEYQRRIGMLTETFSADMIERLPKAVNGKDQDKGKCQPGSGYSIDGFHCGGYHSRSIHLAYVGHAGITARLNDVDPLWYLDIARDGEGFPIMRGGVVTATLYVLDLVRTGNGDGPGGFSPADPYKIAEGDVLRRCAMRMGVGTYLWSKSEAAQREVTNAPDISASQQDTANNLAEQVYQVTIDYPEQDERVPWLRQVEERAKEYGLLEAVVGVPPSWIDYANGRLTLTLAQLIRGGVRAPTAEQPADDEEQNA